MFKAGDNIVIGDDIYGGTFRLFSNLGTKFNIDITLADLSDINNLPKAIKPNTKVGDCILEQIAYFYIQLLIATHIAIL